jgi:hypothetical protein
LQQTHLNKEDIMNMTKKQKAKQAANRRWRAKKALAFGRPKDGYIKDEFESVLKLKKVSPGERKLIALRQESYQEGRTDGHKMAEGTIEALRDQLSAAAPKRDALQHISQAIDAMAHAMESVASLAKQV